MLALAFNKIRSIHSTYREGGPWHAYYSIPVLIGFCVTYGLIQLGVRLAPDFHFDAKGYHIHHYTYGIILLLIFGYIGLWAVAPKVKYLCALAYGVGAAFIIDEAFMWFTLNAGPGYQDYDLFVFVAAIFVGVILAPLFLRGDEPPKI